MSIERMRASRFECEYDSERSDTGLAWAVALGRRLDGASGGAEWAGGDKALRDRTRAALAELGLPEDVRAERLTPAQFRALSEKIGR